MYISVRSPNFPEKVTTCHISRFAEVAKVSLEYALEDNDETLGVFPDGNAFGLIIHAADQEEIDGQLAFDPTYMEALPNATH